MEDFNLAVDFYKKGNYKKAEKYFLKSILNFKSENEDYFCSNKHILPISYYNLGVIYIIKSENTTNQKKKVNYLNIVLKHSYNALLFKNASISKENFKDKESMEGKLYFNMGLTYCRLNNYKKALEYFKKANLCYDGKDDDCVRMISKCKEKVE